MRSFLVALAFLTIVPLRFRKLPTAEDVAASRFWYPVVALLLGAALAAWTMFLSPVGVSPRVAPFLVLLAWVIATGALHLDGFCDLCDGLLGGHTPEDRLRIMKDPHLGTFGLAGGVLLLMGKLVSLQELLPRREAPWLIAGSVVASRCFALCMAALSRYPRPEGTGKALLSATRTWEAVPYLLLAAAATAIAFPPRDWAHGGIVFLESGIAVLALTWACHRRLGGVTGDCLGAAIETAEVVFLLTAALSLPFRGA